MVCVEQTGIIDYYGMCGTDRNYCKVQKEKGRFACLLDMSCIQHMKNKGWILCEKIEYDNYLSRKGKS